MSRSVANYAHIMPAVFQRFRPMESSASWEFVNPENGRKFVAPSRPQLVQMIVNYRAQNQYPPIERLELVLDNYLCGLPCNAGKCELYKLRRGLLKYLSGGIALLSNLWYGEKNMVSQEEADRRAAICVKCPMNIFPDKGPFVKWSDDIALASIGDKKSKYHNELGNCGLCQCPLRCKVFYGGAFTLADEECEAMKSLGCWQPDASKKVQKS